MCKIKKAKDEIRTNRYPHPPPVRFVFVFVCLFVCPGSDKFVLISHEKNMLASTSALLIDAVELQISDIRLYLLAFATVWFPSNL